MKFLSFYTNKMVSFDFSYENVIRCSVKLENSYMEFAKELRKGRIIAFNVVRFVIDNYEM